MDYIYFHVQALQNDALATQNKANVAQRRTGLAQVNGLQRFVLGQIAILAGENDLEIYINIGLWRIAETDLVLVEEIEVVEGLQCHLLFVPLLQHKGFQNPFIVHVVDTQDFAAS